MDVRLPDGRIVKNVPEGTTRSELMRRVGGLDQKKMPPAPDPTQPHQLGGQTIPPPPEPRENPELSQKQSLLRTGLDQGLQGMTGAFADEAVDRIGAGIAALATDEKYDDLLKEARQNTKDRFEAQFEQNPVTAFGSNIAGALATGGAGASTKAGTALTNSLRAGNLATRAVKGAVSGAASGGLYGAGTSGEGERLEGAGKGALTGAVFGGAVPVAGAIAKSGIEGTKNIARGAASRGVDKLDEAEGFIRDKSRKAYDAMRNAKASFKPDAITKAFKSIDDSFSDEMLIPEHHAKTMGIIDRMKKDVADNGMELERLDLWRRALSRVPKTVDGAEDYRMARKAVGAIDDFVDKLSDTDLSTGGKQAVQALQEARTEWARASKFQTIADIVRKSDGDANYIKRELKKLVDNPKKTRGFSTEEREFLKNAANNSGGEVVMKMLGKFGFDPARLGSGVGAMVGSGVGFSAGGPLGMAVVPAAGTAARYAQKGLARGKTEALLRAIESTQAGAPQVGANAAKRLSRTANIPINSIAAALANNPARNP